MRASNSLRELCYLDTPLVLEKKKYPVLEILSRILETDGGHL